MELCTNPTGVMRRCSTFLWLSLVQSVAVRVTGGSGVREAECTGLVATHAHRARKA